MTGFRSRNDGEGCDVFTSVPKSIFGTKRRSARDSKKMRLIQEMVEGRTEEGVHLFSFKMQPSLEVIPDPTDTRPLPRSCQMCLPEADMAILEEMKHLGVSDCFVPPTLSSYNSILCRVFPIYAHYSRCWKFAEMHRLPAWQELASDANLLKLFEGDVQAKEPETKQEILQIMSQLQVSNVWKFFRTCFMRISAWMCHMYLSHQFESVLVHGGQIELLKDVQAKGLPVIYVPTYRSNFDKVLIMWSLAHHGLRTPVFIADHKNKNSFLKYFGGIGASLQVNAGPNSEKKYSSALSVYLQHLLRKGNSVILNLESGRTRTGRPSTNVYGTELLKIMYDEFQNRRIEDLYFVPVSVSYEVLPDGREIFEGQKSGPRSILTYIGSLLYNFVFPTTKTTKGNAKIDFAQPICFRELIKSLEKRAKVRALTDDEGHRDSYCVSRNCSFLRWGSSDSLNSVSSLYGELALLYPDGRGENSKTEATLLDVVNHHLIYDAGKCESVMPTHLVAFILMKKFRRGIYLEQLKEELEWLIQILQSDKKDFGFYLVDADMESIAFRAVELLKDDIVCEWIEAKQTYKFQARQELNSLRKLNYYANYLLPGFMLEAVIATAIFGMKQASTLSVLRGFDIEVRIKDDEFIRHCRRVYNVLTGAFFMNPPCLYAETAIRKQISLMSDKGKLILSMREGRKYMWEEEYDEDYDVEEPAYGGGINDPDCPPAPEDVVIITTESTVDHLLFYRSLVTPYFEIFSFLMTHLEIILEIKDERMDAIKLEKHLLQKLMEQVHTEFRHCGELCTKSTVKQFLSTCEDYAILDMLKVNDTMDRLYTLLKTKDELKRTADDILFYVTA